MPTDPNMLDSYADVIAERDALRAELAAAQGLLLECHGWMNGVEPKPAQPFLDAVLAAAQHTEEPSNG